MHGLGGTQPGEHPTVTGSARNLARIFGKEFLETEKRIFTCKTGTQGGYRIFSDLSPGGSALTFIQLCANINT